MVMLKILFTLLKWVLLCFIVLAAAAAAFVYFSPVFGGKPDAASLARIQASPQFKNGVFTNIEPTQIGTGEEERPSLLTWLSSVLNPPPGKHPAEPLPTHAFDNAAVVDNSFTWFGHSTVLFQTAGTKLLTDPVFYRASPIFIGGKPFAMTHTPQTSELPFVDAVLLSHDHYDHLDERAIKEINTKVGHFYVPLGVKDHLQRWGVAGDKITELDWHESAKLGDVELTLTPARHFSGRNFNSRNPSLWGSWVVKSPQLSVYYNGDSGYGVHFADIGQQYGPFDMALIENGAYNQAWAQIHMMPEESVQAALDVRAQTVMPVHWGKFDLAYHPWKEPVERFLAAAAGQPFRTATPRIGQTFMLDNPPQEKWWENVR